MDIFLVGGAVRDQLLGLTVNEQDWVVVGSTPQQMVDLNFTPVGKDFPVFLHPTTKEEYALARTERKTGPGYSGFECYAADDVSLEEDLLRRDLTINAIAKDADGNLVDPHNGIKDIEAKILRHVSDAFAEDPVRILRVARFAARFHHLGFSIASETMTLMSNMVTNGEVNHLVAERIWKEWSRALSEQAPEVFITVLNECGALKVLMPEIHRLFGVPQPPKHHPEIDCGIHSLMSLQQAALLSNNCEVRFAALVHDLGKGVTPSDVLPSHHGHEQSGLSIIEDLCRRLTIPNDFKHLARAVCQFHTHCHRAFELNPKTIVNTLEQLDAFRRPERFDQFLLACEADSRGRTGFENREYPQADFFRQALSACSAISAKQVDKEKFEGKEIGAEIHRLRVAAVKKLKSEMSLSS